MKVSFKDLYRHMKPDLVLRYLIMYVLVLGVMTIPVILLFNQIFERNEANIISLNRNTMQTTVDVMGNLITKLDKLSIGMNLDVDIMNYVYVKKPYEGRGLHATLDTVSHIKSYDQDTDPAIKETFVYYTASDMLISGNKVYDLAQIIDVGTLDIDGLNKYEWSNLIDSGYKGRQIYGTYEINIYDKSSFRGLIYTNTMGHPGTNYAKLVVLIDVGFLDEYMMNLVEKKEGMYFVYDGEGNLLLKGGADLDYENLDEKDYIITELMSPEYGWEFVTVLSRESLFSELTIYKNRIIIILGFVLIAVFLLSYFLAQMNAKPIKEFSRLMGGHDDDRDEFEFIKNSIDDLFRNYDRITDDNSQHHDMVRSLFFSQLIEGGFRNRDEMTSYSQSLGPEIEKERYAACIIQLIPKSYHGVGDTLETVFSEKTVLMTLLSEEFPHTLCTLGQKSFDRIIVIFGFDESEEMTRELLVENADRIRVRSEKLMGSSVLVAMGSVTESLDSLPYSFYLCRKKMDLLVWQENGTPEEQMSMGGEINRGTPFLIFNSATLKKIMSLLRSGNLEDARFLLDDMLYKNLIAEKLDRSVMVLKINEIIINMVELMEELHMGNEEVIAFTRSMENIGLRIELIKEKLGEQLEKICSVINEKKKSHNNSLFYRINRYVHDNCLDSQLSLQMVAVKFGITDVYLSTFFKEQRGMNFFDYVELERIEHAKDLLQNSNRSVSAVAEECGYNSGNTFAKAFKRRTGMSATEYRLYSRE